MNPRQAKWLNRLCKSTCYDRDVALWLTWCKWQMRATSDRTEVTSKILNTYKSRCACCELAENRAVGELWACPKCCMYKKWLDEELNCEETCSIACDWSRTEDKEKAAIVVYAISLEIARLNKLYQEI